MMDTFLLSLDGVQRTFLIAVLRNRLHQLKQERSMSEEIRIVKDLLFELADRDEERY